MDRYLVSACLCGVNCKYNGGNNKNDKCVKLLNEGKAVLICPEQLGGLATPRKPSEIKQDKVINCDKLDVTKYFIKGAEESLNIAKISNINKAILKEGSPSCGVNKIYDGSFTGNKISESGITARLLKKNNIEVISSDDF